MLNSGLTTQSASAKLGQEGRGMAWDYIEAFAKDPARALTLAGLKARLAELER